MRMKMGLWIAIGVVGGAGLSHLVHLGERVAREFPFQTNDAVREVASARDTRERNESARQILDWLQFQSGELRDYTKKLRDAGVPEVVVRDIILGEIERRLVRDWLSTTNGQTMFSFSNVRYGSEKESVSSLEAYLRNAFHQKKIEKAREILGSSALDDLANNFHQALQDTRFSFVSPDKRLAVAELKQTYETRLAEAISGFPPEPSELDMSRKLREEFDVRLCTLLSPEEKREYAIRFSDLAKRLRVELATFQPTEDEFRNIFELKQRYDGATVGAAFAKLSGDARMDLQEQAQSKLDDALAQTLGEGRYRQYKRCLDVDYQVLRRFLDRQAADSSTAALIYDLQQDIQKQLGAVFSREDLDSNQKQQYAKQLRGFAEKKIESLLGASTFATFKSHPTGVWLRLIGGGTNKEVER